MVDKTIDEEFTSDTLKTSAKRLLTTDPSSGNDEVGIVSEVELVSGVPAHQIQVDDSAVTNTTNAIEIIKKTGQDPGLERFKISSKGEITQKPVNLTAFSDFLVNDITEATPSYFSITSANLAVAHNNGLSIYDITDSKVPEFIETIRGAEGSVGSYKDFKNISCVKHHGSFIYISFLGGDSNEVTRIDITNPGTVPYDIAPLVSFASGNATAIAILDGSGFVSEIQMTFRGDNYTATELVAMTLTTVNLGAGATADALVDPQPAGIAMIDTTDIEIPLTEIEVVTDTQIINNSLFAASLAQVNRFVIYGNFGYFADTTGNAITVMDFTDPINPTVGAILNIASGFFVVNPFAITVYDNLVYFSNINSGDLTDPIFPGIRVLQVDGKGTTPLNPGEVSFINGTNNGNLGNIGDIVVQGAHAFCAPGLGEELDGTGDAFNIVDFSDLLSPEILSTTTVGIKSGQIHVHGDYVLLPSLDDSTNPIFQILDVSDLTAPNQMFFLDNSVTDGIQGCFSHGNHLFLGGFDSPDMEVLVYDMQGIFTQAMNIGVLNASQLQVSKHAHMQTLDIQSFMHVGAGGMHTDGKLTAAQSSSVRPISRNADLSDPIGQTELTVDFADDEQIIVITGMPTGVVGGVPIVPVNLIPGHRATIFFNSPETAGADVLVFNNDLIMIGQAGDNTILDSAERVMIEMQVVRRASGFAVFLFAQVVATLP